MHNIQFHDDQDLLVLKGLWPLLFIFQFNVISLSRMLLVFEKEDLSIGKSIWGIIPSANVSRMSGFFQTKPGMIGFNLKGI